MQLDSAIAFYLCGIMFVLALITILGVARQRYMKKTNPDYETEPAAAIEHSRQNDSRPM
ncbi:MAG TPA: hypothetical protein VLL97_13825 [Acidobacteriota bacterium]|nr:hypothetical protein [Acidobacteriota bacterium]